MIRSIVTPYAPGLLMVIVNIALLFIPYNVALEVFVIVNGLADADTVTGVPAPNDVFNAYL